MAYVALYRAYRPQRFSDVVGQEHIIKTLQNAINLNKVAHAYLFCGPRGTGKTTLAKIMAKAMNCVNGPISEPCCECDVCRGIAKGVISDVIEIDAASNNGADDIRALRDTVKFLPAVGKYKVYIIDEVHMLSNAAFNALLKTLEEPPKHVIFILATTEPYKLPNTILSRCQRFDFQSIEMENLLKRLHIVASEENIKITDEALYQIAIASEGGMRDALSLFDQCISYSVNPEITLDDVLSVSGNISYLKITELCSACINDNTKAILLLDSILKEGKEVPRVINDIILFLRDTLMYKNNAVLEDKLMYKNKEFIALSQILTPALIYSWLDILNDALNQMRFSTQKRAFLELAILKMNDKKLIETVNLLERIESLEKTVEMLSRVKTPTYSQPKNEYNIHIPSAEELNNMRGVTNPAPVQTPQPVVTVNNPVTVEDNSYEAPVQVESKPAISVNSETDIVIKDIEDILYSASKAAKEKLNGIISQIEMKYNNNFIIQLFCRGKIVAASENKFILAMQDTGFCNRVMLYENYVKLVEIFLEYNYKLEDYICITDSKWNLISKDYRSKYSKDNPKPRLEEIQLGIKRRVIPTQKMKKTDELVDKVLEYIDEKDLKILEE